MAVTHHATIRNTLVDAVLTAIDQDVGAGALEITTAVDALLVTIPLADPAGTVSGAVLTFDTTPQIEATASGTGDAAKFIITDNSGDEIFYGSVAASGADINLSSIGITSGDTVAITSLTYTSAV